jgi:hypothetical protein
VVVIALGADCSITSTVPVSTIGARGRLIRRAAFFTGARFGLALATVRFAVRAAFCALPRLAGFPLRSFARFDPFFRLAMIDPFWLVRRNALMFDQK